MEEEKQPLLNNTNPDSPDFFEMKEIGGKAMQSPEASKSHVEQKGDEDESSASDSDEDQEFETQEGDLDEYVSSVMIESTGFEMNNEDKIILMST